MSTVILPIPPANTQVFDQTGVMTEEWRRYFLALSNFTGSEVPPIDAEYWISQSNPTLTNEVNIGALASGYLKVAVALGTAVPSSVAQIPGGDLTNASVPNAKLATMAAHTFKARYTNSTGTPEDATATEATSLLDVLVGDSGAGGTKGLAPAPAAGDAAAGKFLKADGTYAIPAGTGINQLTGNVTAGPGSGSQVATIAAQAVTFARMQDIATQILIGRNTAGTGSPESVTISQALDWLP